MALVTKPFGDIITFTRASTATFFSSSGVLTSAAIDAPRFDYNPSTLAARGLLIEEARTNLITSSAALPTPGVNVAITSDAFAAPDGTTTGDQILDNATLSEHYTDSSFTPTAATNYTFSAFIRAIGATSSPFACLRMAGDFSAFVFVNLSTFAITTGGANFVSASIQPINGGWYRVSVTGLSVGTTASVARVQVTNATALAAYSGTGQGFAVWGRQLEVGAFPTSLIPTTGTTLTRSADVASVNTLSPWFNATESTLFMEVTPVGVKSTASPIVTIDDGTTSNRIAMTITAANAMQNSTVVSGALSGNTTTPSTTYAANSTYKIAFAVKLDDVQSFSGGAAGTVDTTALIPSGLTALKFTAQGASTGLNNVWMRRFTYYPRRLSAAEGAAITT